MMKSKIIFLFLATFATFATFSQEKDEKRWLRVGLMATSIVLSGVGDGLYDDGHKTLSKSFKAASLATLVAVPVFTKVDKRNGLKYVASFALLRYGLFNTSYNATRGLRYNYMGTTSLQDRALRNIPSYLVSMSRFTAICLVIDLNKNRYEKQNHPRY
jgi:hypothetical protein